MYSYFLTLSILCAILVEPTFRQGETRTRKNILKELYKLVVPIVKNGSIDVSMLLNSHDMGASRDGNHWGKRDVYVFCRP